MGGMDNDNGGAPVVAVGGRRSADVRLLGWLDGRRTLVQLGCVVVLGAPWVLAPWGLRWVWWALAVAPLVAYGLAVTIWVETPGEGAADVDG